MYQDSQLLIDGSWGPASAGRTHPVVNPATGQTIGTFAWADKSDLDRALASVDKGFKVWKKVSAHERSKIMRKAANLLRDRVEHVATLMTMEQGKTLSEAKAEIQNGADTIDWFAEEGRRAYGRVIPARAEGVYQLVVKEPVGPVAAFTPWNFPINQIVRKLSAALAAGCSIIVKAPEETPASPAELIRAFVDAGVPPGTVNLVYGDPAEISSYLIPHPVIRKISFTGSTAVGKHLAALAGQHMKRATMELGGHAPVIVFDDADVAVAAKVMAASKFRNAGQVCISPTRFLVQEGVYDSFVEQFVANTKKLKVGNGLETGMNMGALANPASRDRDGSQHGGREQARRQGPHRRASHRQGRQLLGADRRHRAAERRQGDERRAVRPARGDQPVQDLRRRGDRGEPAAVRTCGLCVDEVGKDGAGDCGECRDRDDVDQPRRARDSRGAVRRGQGFGVWVGGWERGDRALFESEVCDAGGAINRQVFWTPDAAGRRSSERRPLAFDRAQWCNGKRHQMRCRSLSLHLISGDSHERSPDPNGRPLEHSA
jgi:acyl-CoA reductase-like NAD-dependent aldehyde dehydrogenase